MTRSFVIVNREETKQPGRKIRTISNFLASAGERCESARDPSPVNRARHSVQSRETKVRNREEKRLRFFEFVKIQVLVRVDAYKRTCEYERVLVGERGTRSFPAELQLIGRREKTGGVGMW